MTTRVTTSPRSARMLIGGIIAVAVVSFFAFALRVHAQEFVAADPAVERDARRVEDLQRIKKGLDLYSTLYWSYPRYYIQSPAMSDDYWRHTTTSKDFRKRMKNFINQLPVDPWNDPMRNFRYVYGYVPSDYEEAPDCAGKTILFASRVETDAAEYHECDFGGTDKRILYVITSDKKTAMHDVLAGALMALAKLFPFHP